MGVDTQKTTSSIDNENPPPPLKEIILELDELLTNGFLAKEHNLPNKLIPGKPVIKALALILATDCNLRCDYCYAEGGSYNHERGLMDFSVAKAAIDLLVEGSKGSNEVGISFFGGEPLLNFECIKDAVPYAIEQFQLVKKKCYFGITTNGILLNPANLKFLLDNDFSLIISIDGPPEVHNKYRKFTNNKGSYDRVVKNLVNLNKIFPDFYNKITIRATFTGHDHDMISRLSHLYDLGFKKIALESCAATPEHLGIDKKDLENILSDYNKTALWYLNELKTENLFSFNHFTQLFEQVSKATKRITQCGAGRGYLTVSPKGMLYPCHRMAGNDAFAMGTVFKGPDPDIQRLFGSVSVPFKDKCMSCWARYICGGGCHATAVQFNENILHPYDIDCELMKHRIKLGAWLFSEMADYQSVQEKVPTVC